MNRIAAIALLAIATSMTSASASAQSAVLKVDVPFDFAVSNNVLPAGSYTLGFDPAHPSVLLIEDRTKSVKARAFVERGLIGRGTLHTVTFHRYGGQYFLSEIHLDSALEGVLLPETKLEVQAGRAGRTEEVASIAGR
jgi:hypothetical protein